MIGHPPRKFKESVVFFIDSPIWLPVNMTPKNYALNTITNNREKGEENGRAFGFGLSLAIEKCVRVKRILGKGEFERCFVFFKMNEGQQFLNIPCLSVSLV